MPRQTTHKKEERQVETCRVIPESESPKSTGAANPPKPTSDARLQVARGQLFVANQPISGTPRLLAEDAFRAYWRRILTRGVIEKMIESVVDDSERFNVFLSTARETEVGDSPLRDEDLFGPGDAEFFNSFLPKVASK